MTPVTSDAFGHVHVLVTPTLQEMAGRLDPPHLVDQLVGCLTGLGPITVNQIDITNEKTHFALPKQAT